MLRFFRRKPFSREDEITWTQLTDAAFELHPAELMDEIRPLFRQGIVDPVMTALDEFEREEETKGAFDKAIHEVPSEPQPAFGQPD